VRAAAIALCLALCASALTACGPEARGAEAFAGPVLRSGAVRDIPFEVLAEGQGSETLVGDWVMVHYRLLLENGTLVDTSHGKKPLAMFAGKDRKVIDGFQRGVVGMKIGELRRITVPHHLGYGARALPKIPANSNLVFELELIKRDR
jgi:FKBP-type peptidyl-prolyl cis-trans isomerase